jgi:hypothetical protein
MTMTFRSSSRAFLWVFVILCPIGGLCPGRAGPPFPTCGRMGPPLSCLTWGRDYFPAKATSTGTLTVAVCVAWLLPVE